MSFPPYPDYKDSRINWLGPAPTHWTVKRLRHVASLNPGKSQVRRLPPETEVTFLPMEAVGDDGSLDRRHAKPLGEVVEGYTYLGERDVAFAKITPCFENGKAALATNLKNELAFATTELTVLRPDTRVVSARYLYRLVTSRPFRELGEASMYGAGGQKRVPDNFARDFAIPLPPPDEQRQIADFLDHETARIDALIEEQQRLVELLAEERDTRITHAVTRGLDASTSTRDSGLDWLGEIPAHWEVRKISTVTDKVTNGYVGPTRDVLKNSGVRYLQSLHIKRNQINFDPPYYVDEQWSQDHSKSILREGDVLVVQTGDIGQVAYVPGEFAGSNCHALIILSPITNVLDGRFLSWVLNSSYGFNALKSVQTGALHPHLNCGYVRDIYIPVPPIREQSEIVQYLEEAESEFDGLVNEIRSGENLLKERRAAVISAAVTGKIDVREWNHSTPSTEQVLPQVAEEEGRYG